MPLSPRVVRVDGLRTTTLALCHCAVGWRRRLQPRSVGNSPHSCYGQQAHRDYSPGSPLSLLPTGELRGEHHHTRLFRFTVCVKATLPRSPHSPHSKAWQKRAWSLPPHTRLTRAASSHCRSALRGNSSPAHLSLLGYAKSVERGERTNIHPLPPGANPAFCYEVGLTPVLLCPQSVGRN